MLSEKQKNYYLKTANYECVINDYSSDTEITLNNRTYEDVQNILYNFNKNYNDKIASVTIYGVPECITMLPCTYHSWHSIEVDLLDNSIYSQRYASLTLDRNARILDIFFNR